MLFDGRPVSPAGAAYAAATQTDNLDAHDGYNPVKGHIGVAIIPSILALAETVAAISGPQALAFTTIGYEIAGRAGLSLHGSVSDYHTSGAWNALGVAAVGARMRDLTRAQLREALGIAEFHGPRSQMMREIANPSMLHDGSGMGALTGVSAAILAEKGFTGAPAITVESEEVAHHWGNLGSDWVMENQYVKPYPICRWAHAPIDAVRQIMRDKDLAHTDIAAIKIRTFRESAALFAGQPQTTSQAQYSLPFAVAVQAVHGEIGVEHITGPGLTDPDVAAIRELVSVDISELHQRNFPQHRTAEATIVTRDRRTFTSDCVHARGGTETPFEPADIEEKFLAFASPPIGRARAEQIRDTVMSLQDPGSCLSALNALVYGPPKA